LEAVVEVIQLAGRIGIYLGAALVLIGAVYLIGSAIWAERPRTQDQMDEAWLRRFRKEHPYE
jgi:hypothetical protein